MKAATLDIILPTYDNVEQLIQCLQSMMKTQSVYPFRILVVNNGKHDLEQILPKHEKIVILKPKENLGWEGGLKFGLEQSISKYVMFANDDIYIPTGQVHWISNMIRHMELYPWVAAVGPSSNTVMGTQNIWSEPTNINSFYTTFLIGFCMLVSRRHLDHVGGVDDSLPGGDDLDLSIRFRKAGFALVCDKSVFVYHHGFQTGNRVYGDSSVIGGWNSQQMTDKTNKALIQKHGFMAWWELFRPAENEARMAEAQKDKEGEVVKRYIKGGVIVEMGVGGKYTVEPSIGIDIYKKGEYIDTINQVSVADIQADVQWELPIEDETIDTIIARHILEHCIDPVTTLSVWKRKLKKGGRLIISVPDESYVDSIPMNPEHVHAFTVDSLKALGEVLGLTYVGHKQKYNGVSFTVCFKK